MNHARLFIVLGASNAALAVALGAFGAHGLRAHLTPELLAIWQTGVQYHFLHALGLVLVGFAPGRIPDGRALRGAGWAMLAGIVLFSGSLYGLSLGGLRWLGAVAPLGGGAFILGWSLFAWAAARAPR